MNAGFQSLVIVAPPDHESNLAQLRPGTSIVLTQKIDRGDRPIDSRIIRDGFPGAVEWVDLASVSQSGGVRMSAS